MYTFISCNSGQSIMFHHCYEWDILVQNLNTSKLTEEMRNKGIFHTLSVFCLLGTGLMINSVIVLKSVYALDGSYCFR